MEGAGGEREQSVDATYARGWAPGPAAAAQERSACALAPPRGGACAAGFARLARMDDYAAKTVPQLKALCVERGIKVKGVGWPTCCPPDGNKAAVIQALRRLDAHQPAAVVATPVKQERPSAQPRSPPFSGVKEPQLLEPEPDASTALRYLRYVPQTTCGRIPTAQLAQTDAETARLLGEGLKLPSHVPLICTSFRSSNLKDVDGRVELWQFICQTLRCGEEQGKAWATNINRTRAAWGEEPIRTMRDYSRACLDEATLALCMSDSGGLEKTRSKQLERMQSVPTTQAAEAAAKLFEEVGVADPWSMCDYLRERAAWTQSTVFIDAEVYGMYAHWHTVYKWAQKHCEVMVMFISRGWYHSKWCTKEWFEDYKGMGKEMPKIFVVLLDTLPVTGYRIDDGDPNSEGAWVPEESPRTPREFWLEEIRKMQASVSRDGLTAGPADVTFGETLSLCLSLCLPLSLSLPLPLFLCPCFSYLFLVSHRVSQEGGWILETCSIARPITFGRKGGQGSGS